MATAKKGFLFWSSVCVLSAAIPHSQAQDVCEQMNYQCEEGHCCGRGHCCTYYYELWWFWFVWLAIAVTGICCFYQKKVKRRAFLNRFFNLSLWECEVMDGGGRLGAEVNTASTQTGLTADKVFNLPSYEELRDLTKDPPSYTQIYSGDEEAAIDITADTDSSPAVPATSVNPGPSLLLPPPPSQTPPQSEVPPREIPPLNNLPPLNDLPLLNELPPLNDLPPCYEADTTTVNVTLATEPVSMVTESVTMVTEPPQYSETSGGERSNLLNAHSDDHSREEQAQDLDHSSTAQLLQNEEATTAEV